MFFGQLCVDGNHVFSLEQESVGFRLFFAFPSLFPARKPNSGYFLDEKM